LPLLVVTTRRRMRSKHLADGLAATGAAPNPFGQ
jgi:hypothetical protein